MASTLSEEKTGVCVLGVGREISELRSENTEKRWRKGSTDKHPREAKG